MTTRLLVGPFNRVEGDLEVSLDIADGQVRSAQVSSSLYRGFENMLIGRDPLDALVLVPRICGICSVAQSAAAAAALAALFADHLALEERTIFPAIAALPADVQATIRAEMLARRR